MKIYAAIPGYIRCRKGSASDFRPERAVVCGTVFGDLGRNLREALRTNDIENRMDDRGFRVSVRNRDVARDLGKSQQEVSLVVNALFARLATAILDGERITISSFGTFTPKDRPEHNGYDPHRRVSMRIPACRTVHFTASSVLQRRIRERHDA